DATVEPAAIAEPRPIAAPEIIVESGEAAEPDVNGAPETTVEPDASVEPGADPFIAVEIIVGAESEAAGRAGGWSRGDGGGATGAAGVSDERFSRRLSSARAPACEESSAIASTAKRRAASRDPL